ncbi:MAG: lipopolysaccharide biosynthesis protein [Bacteroidota bacterium]
MIRRVLKDSSLVLFGDALATFVSGFLLVPLYTGHMPTADYGVVVIIGALASVLGPLLCLSLPSAFLRYYFEVPEEDRPSYAGSLLLFSAVLTGAFALLWILCLGWIRKTFLPNLPPEALLWVMAVVALAVVRGLVDTLLRLRMRFKVIVMAALTQSSLLLVLAILLVKRQHLGLYGWAYGNIGATLLVTVPLVLLMRRDFKFRWLGPEVKRSLRFSLPLVVGYLGWFMANRSGLLVIQRYLSLSDAGIYGVAYSFGMLFLVAGQAMDKVVGPVFYRDITKPDGPAWWARLTVVFTSALSWLALSVCLFARPVFTLLFPHDYLKGLPLLPIIIWAFICKCLDIFFIRGLFYREKTMMLMMISVGTGLLNVGLNLWLIPRYGLTAAAYATLISYGLASIVGLVLSQRVMRLPYRFGMFLFSVGLPLVFSFIAWRSDSEHWTGADWMLRLGLWAGASAVTALIVWRCRGSAAGAADDTHEGRGANGNGGSDTQQAG